MLNNPSINSLAKATPPIIQTKYGKVTGKNEQINTPDATDLYPITQVKLSISPDWKHDQYLRIPYAKSPTAKLRFKPPVTLDLCPQCDNINENKPVEGSPTLLSLSAKLSQCFSDHFIASSDLKQISVPNRYQMRPIFFNQAGSRLIRSPTSWMLLFVIMATKWHPARCPFKAKIACC